jgi:hypothetical protein
MAKLGNISGKEAVRAFQKAMANCGASWKPSRDVEAKYPWQPLDSAA